MEDDYQFGDVDDSPATPAPAQSTGQGTNDDHGMTSDDTGSAHDSSSMGMSSSSQGGGKYADEIFSKQIRATFRTFYVDLKESSNGKFVKISEKSHGRKSTIMMDGEDIDAFIEALQEVKGHL